MRFIETEEILGALVSYLLENGITKVTETQIMEFNFHFISVANVHEKTMCKIDRKDIIKFADSNRNLISFRFDLSELYVKKENRDQVKEVFYEMYFEKLKKQVQNLDEVIDAAWKKMK